jgi:hypothetical protein
VQHGPGSKVVHNAISILKRKGAFNLENPEFDKQLVQAIYAERGRKGEDGNLVYFRKNSLAVQKGVKKRFINEQKDALEMLRNEKKS